MSLYGAVRVDLLLPHILAAEDLLVEDELLATRVEMFYANYAEYTLPWAKVTVTKRDLSLEMSDARRFETALDLLTSLPNIEYKDDYAVSRIDRVVMLRAVHYKISSRAAAERRMATLVSSELARQQIAPLRLHRLTYGVDPGKTSAAARLTVEPSRRDDSWLFVQSSMDWAPTDVAEVTPGAGEEADTRLDFLDQVARDWQLAVDLTHNHIQWVLQDMAPLWAPRQGRGGKGDEP